MRIVDRYIFSSIIKIFISTILAFCLLYIIVDLASNLNEIIDRKVTFVVLVRFYISLLPVILTQTATIACLISTLLTYSHLNSNNEVTALRAGGLNFWQITKTAIIFGLVVSSLIFWINEKFVPTATMSSEQIRDDNIILKVDTDKKKKDKIKNLTFYGLRNRLYFIDTFDPNNFDLEGITILGHDNEQNVIEKIVALKGQWTAEGWKLFNCQTTTFNPKATHGNPNNPVDIKYAEAKLMDIQETPQDFLRQRLNVSSMNLKQLYGYIKRFAHSGAIKALNNLRVDFHQKIAYPFCNIIILLVGLPLSLMTGRRKAVTFTSLGVAMGVGFLFYVTNAVGIALGKGGFFPPMLAAWCAPLLFSAMAIYLIKKKF